MRTVEIPISIPSSANVSNAGLKASSAFLLNGFVDEEGNDERRPGSILFKAVTGSPRILGLHYWKMIDRLIAVTATGVFSYDRDGNEFSIASDTIYAGDRCYFIENGNDLTMTTGRYISNSTGGAMFTNIADPDTPVYVTRIAYLDDYILAIDRDTNRFYWSTLGTIGTWSALNFASAASNPDNIVSILVRDAEIFLFGEKSLEIWENDGTTPFSRIPGGRYSAGCVAPHSPVSVDDGRVFWLDNDRHFNIHEGGIPKRLYSPYDKDIYKMARVDDCLSDLVYVDGREFIKFKFPSERRTFIYHYMTDFWYEWSRYDTFLGDDLDYPYREYCRVEPWGKLFASHITVDSDNNETHVGIVELSSEYGTDNGNLIRMARRTGQLSHGNLKDKRCEELRICVRRGETEVTDEANLSIRWRDNNESQWQEEQHGLGQEGDRDIVIESQRLGIFKTRQWEFVISQDVPATFIQAEADITDLR